MTTDGTRSTGARTVGHGRLKAAPTPMDSESAQPTGTPGEVVRTSRPRFKLPWQSGSLLITSTPVTSLINNSAPLGDAPTTWSKGVRDE